VGSPTRVRSWRGLAWDRTTVSSEDAFLTRHLLFASEHLPEAVISRVFHLRFEAALCRCFARRALEKPKSRRGSSPVSALSAREADSSSRGQHPELAWSALLDRYYRGFWAVITAGDAYTARRSEQMEGWDEGPRSWMRFSRWTQSVTKPRGK
jgi:hypothetical protein